MSYHVRSQIERYRTASFDNKLLSNANITWTMSKLMGLPEDLYFRGIVKFRASWSWMVDWNHFRSIFIGVKKVLLT